MRDSIDVRNAKVKHIPMPELGSAAPDQRAIAVVDVRAHPRFPGLLLRLDLVRGNEPVSGSHDGLVAGCDTPHRGLDVLAGDEGEIRAIVRIGRRQMLDSRERSPSE